MKYAFIRMSECVKKFVKEMAKRQAMGVGFLTATAAKFLIRH